MTQTTSTIPGAAVRGIASGIFFMAFFGTLWASIGVGGLQELGGLWLSVVVVLVGIGLFIGGLTLQFASRRLPNIVSEEDTRHGKRIGVWFGIVFGAEMLLIMLASYICNAIGRFDLFFPIMALIVGIHFLPLAPLFQVKTYYLVGALLCLLALITLFVVPQNSMLSGQPINAQSVVLGFGASLILWGVGVYLWLIGRRLLALSK